jgi:DedD protein
LEYRLSTPFQNRLVGTIIVAAAIVIFLPDILDGKKKSNQADFDAIPQAPSFTGKMVNKPFPDDDLILKEKPVVSDEEAQDNQLSTNNEISTDKLNETIVNKTENLDAQITQVTPATKVKIIDDIPRSKIKNTSSIEKSTLGQQPSKAVNKEAWAIQLGSFKHKSNVDELVNKLKENGYTVFTKPIQTKKGTLTKVFVGPELIKATLSKKIPALKKLTNVQGKVARFHPN